MMKERETGRSSLTLMRSIYYVNKVLLAMVIGITRRRKRGALR